MYVTDATNCKQHQRVMTDGLSLIHNDCLNEVNRLQQQPAGVFNKL